MLEERGDRRVHARVVGDEENQDRDDVHLDRLSAAPANRASDPQAGIPPSSNAPGAAGERDY